MNSSFSLYVLPSTDYTFERQSSPTVSFVLESTPWPSSSTTFSGSMLERFRGRGVKSHTSDINVTNTRYTAINASTVSVGLTPLFSGSVVSRDNQTRKTTEDEKGAINIVTILLVVSSCLLLWIIIIVIGLIRQRLEKRKQNTSPPQEVSSTTELDRTQDSTRHMPLHLRARRIYEGLQSYDISSQVPNGITNGGKTPQGNIRKLSRNMEGTPHTPNTIHRNGNHIPRDVPPDIPRDIPHDTPRDIPRLDKNISVDHDNNSNTISGPCPGVEIIISEPCEDSEPEKVLTYDNIAMSKEDINDCNSSEEQRSDILQTESNIEIDTGENNENVETNGLVNEGFLNNDCQDAEQTNEEAEQTTEL